MTNGTEGMISGDVLFLQQESESFQSLRLTVSEEKHLYRFSSTPETPVSSAKQMATMGKKVRKRKRNIHTETN